MYFIKKWFSYLDVILVTIVLGLGTIGKDYSAEFVDYFVIASVVYWLLLRLLKMKWYFNLIGIYLYAFILIVFLVNNKPKHQLYVGYTPDALPIIAGLYTLLAIAFGVAALIYILPRLYRRYLKSNEKFNSMKDTVIKELNEIDKA